MRVKNVIMSKSIKNNPDSTKFYKFKKKIVIILDSDAIIIKPIVIIKCVS